MITAYCHDCEAMHEVFELIWTRVAVCPRVGSWTMAMRAWTPVHVDSDPGDEQ